VYVYFRYDEQDKYMVILNKQEGDYQLGLQRFEEILGQAQQGTDVLDGKTYDMTQQSITLPARAAIILKVE